MKIETKYELGSKLWMIEKSCWPVVAWVVRQPMSFDYIICTTEAVYYANMGEVGLDEWVDETDLYASEEEAQAECNRRNGK